MKKVILSILILSLLLATLTACGAEAKQSAEPEPTPKIEEPKPEPLSAPEKTEISQEELEPIFEQVYTEASGNHPEDWSIDFQITDEIGKITKAIPEDKKAPANLREVYTEWRTAKNEGMEWEVEIAESDGSTDEENYAEIDRILAEMEASLEDYEPADPDTIVAGVTNEDLEKYKDTSGEPSYDEGRDYVEDPSVLTDAPTETWGNFHPNEAFKGMTEEEIQAKLEEGRNVEYPNASWG